MGSERGCSAFLAGPAWIHGCGGASINRTAELLLDLTKTELKRLMWEMKGGLGGLKSPRTNVFGCIPPGVQDARAATSGFSAVGACAGQVEGGAHNCCFFWFTGFPNCSENQKTSKPFCLEMRGVLCLPPEWPILAPERWVLLIASYLILFKGKKQLVKTKSRPDFFGCSPTSLREELNFCLNHHKFPHKTTWGESKLCWVTDKFSLSQTGGERRSGGLGLLSHSSSPCSACILTPGLSPASQGEDGEHRIPTAHRPSVGLPVSSRLGSKLLDQLCLSLWMPLAPLKEEFAAGFHL